MPPAPLPKAPAEAVAADKEKKRKDKLAELKVELHKRLLENLNLAALEHASEANLKQEIAAIANEALEEMQVALPKDDRAILNQELYDEVMALARWNRCSRMKPSTIFWSTARTVSLSNARASWN